MKYCFVLWTFSLLVVASCKNGVERQEMMQTATKGVAADCSWLTDKTKALNIGKDLLDEIADNKAEHKNIWNLSSVDTSEFLCIEDYFTNTKTKSWLVYLSGEAGMSAGNANHLLMIFNCTDSLRMVWAGQVGVIDREKIIDYNGDGVKDIVCECGSTWMGECNDVFEIYNFKGGVKNILYSAHSQSIIECGFDTPLENHIPGDTVETKIESTIIQAPKSGDYSVKRRVEWKIHAGGENEKQMLFNLKTVLDSSIVELK